MFYKETNFQDSTIGRIPKEWEVDKLRSVVEIHDSKRIPLSEMERKDRKGPYPYCGANGIIDYINDYIFDGEFVLLAEDGGSYGKFESSAYVMSGKFWVNNHAHILRAIAEKTSNQFLKLVLDFLDLNPYIVGSTRKKLNQEQMREIKIPVPSVEEQRAIVGVLGVVDSAIELVDKVIAKTERLKKGLMQTLLTKGIGHKEYKDTEIGRMPKEWQIVQINDAAENIKRGPFGGSIKKEIFVKEGYKVYEQRNVIDNDFETGDYYVDKKKFDAMKSFSIKQGDVLLTGAGTIGRIAVVPKNFKPGIINQPHNKITLDNRKILVPFFAYLLTHGIFKGKVLERSHGATMKNLSSIKELKSIKIPLPQLQEQQRIVEILNSVDMKSELEKREKSKFERIKQGLMNLLLTGKVRVEVD